MLACLFVQIGSDDLTKWAGESGDWVPMEAEAQMSYIDLTKNPEVNKGYVPPLWWDCEYPSTAAPITLSHGTIAVGVAL